MKTVWQSLAIGLCIAWVAIAAWFIFSPTSSPDTAIHQEIIANRHLLLEENARGITLARQAHAGCDSFPTSSWQHTYCLKSTFLSLQSELALRRQILATGN